MKTIFITWGVSLAIAIGSVSSAVAELTVSELEIANLGIEMSLPQVSERTTVLEAPGLVVLPPNAEVAVATPQSGVVIRQHVTVGEPVADGQPLADIMSTQYVALQREYLEAVIDADLTQRQLQRDRQLLTEGIISRRRVEETEARAQAAAARLDEHQQLLQLVGMDAAAVQLLRERRTLHKALTIRAPLRGVILESQVVVGSHVEALSSLFRIGDLSTLGLDVRLPAASLDNVVPGMPIYVAARGGELQGNIVTVAQAVDTKTQTAMAHAVFAESTDVLRPGQWVTVQIGAQVAVSTDASVLRVPTSAVVHSGNGSYVFVRSESGFSPLEVQVSTVDRIHSYITKGITSDSTIAVRGVSVLKALWLSQAAAGT